MLLTSFFILLLSFFALPPAAMGSAAGVSDFPFAPLTEDDILRVADNVVGGTYDEFFSLNSDEKLAVIEVLLETLDPEVFEQLRDHYFETMYAERHDRPTGQGNCAWWSSLGEDGRNYQIVIEALYAVDQDIWGQNSRLPCAWDSYLKGGCCLMGDWNYTGGGTGKGGQCKPFAKMILERASGGAATLPCCDIYDYRPWYAYRNRQHAIENARGGELMQLIGSLHTAIIISNFHNGWFEVVDSNYCGTERIAKHVFNVGSDSWRGADLKSYVIDCY